MVDAAHAMLEPVRTNPPAQSLEQVQWWMPLRWSATRILPSAETSDLCGFCAAAWRISPAWMAELNAPHRLAVVRRSKSSEDALQAECAACGASHDSCSYSTTNNTLGWTGMVWWQTAHYLAMRAVDAGQTQSGALKTVRPLTQLISRELHARPPST